jgi:transposase-like protein
MGADQNRPARRESERIGRVLHQSHRTCDKPTVRPRVFYYFCIVGREVEGISGKDGAVEPGLDHEVREALAMFADELSAHRYLERMLWPDGVCCPRCDSTRVGKLNGASTRLGTYKCYGCRKAFSLLHGTMMGSSHVPAHKWLQAIYLTECGTRPMRPHHLQQILNVSSKTASSMMRRIAEAADSLRPVATTTAPSPAPLLLSLSAGTDRAEGEIGQRALLVKSQLRTLPGRMAGKAAARA